jgi:hypothetical protein
VHIMQQQPVSLTLNSPTAAAKKGKTRVLSELRYAGPTLSPSPSTEAETLTGATESLWTVAASPASD